jgi:hypothetical protein
MSNAIPANTVVHFARGNYSVSNLTPKTGVQLLGTGKNVTNFLWDGEPQLAMISAYGGSDGVLVSDLTLNGQQDVWGATPEAVNIYDSNNVAIRNVRVTNFKGGASEGFPLVIFCGTISVTGELIENCEVDHYVSGGPKGASLLGLGHGGGGDPTSTVSGIVQNNYIHDCPGVQGIAAGGTNSVYQGNLVVGADKGWYHDSYRISGSQVIKNQFLNCTHFGIVSNSSAGGIDNPSDGCDGLIVANNIVTMDPTITVAVCGVGLGQTYVTNSQVWGNSVTKTNANQWEYGYLITGPGSIVHNNYASPGFTNIIR